MINFSIVSFFNFYLNAGNCFCTHVWNESGFHQPKINVYPYNFFYWDNWYSWTRVEEHVQFPTCGQHSSSHLLCPETTQLTLYTSYFVLPLDMYVLLLQCMYSYFPWFAFTYFVLQEERKQASFEQLLRVANSEREVKLKGRYKSRTGSTRTASPGRINSDRIKK